MALSIADFQSLPPGLPVPTALELHAMAIRGAGWDPSDRVMVMNTLGALIGIPPGGWPGGQSRVFDGNDIRLVWLLRRLARQAAANAVAQSIGFAARFVATDLMLTVVTAAREHSSSLEAVSMKPIHSYYDGGLDFLWKEKDKLGLPNSITKNWVKAPTMVNPETNRTIFPAKIPARDQVLVYAAQLNASFLNYFGSHMQAVARQNPGIPAGAWTGSRVARIVWRAYAFLAPGGGAFDENRPFAQQNGQTFGCRTALTYLATKAKGGSSVNLLDRILVDPQMNALEWVRIAKARCAETLFLERLWRTTRELLPW